MFSLYSGKSFLCSWFEAWGVQHKSASFQGPLEGCSEEPGKSRKSLAEVVQQNPESRSSSGANAELGVTGKQLFL